MWVLQTMRCAIGLERSFLLGDNRLLGCAGISLGQNGVKLLQSIGGHELLRTIEKRKKAQGNGGSCGSKNLWDLPEAMVKERVEKRYKLRRIESKN